MQHWAIVAIVVSFRPEPLNLGSLDKVKLGRYTVMTTYAF